MRALTWRKLLSFPVALGLSVLVAVPVLAGDGVGPLPRGRVLAPVLGQGQPGAIPGRYIVVMKESVSKRDMRDAMLTARSKGAVRVTQRYDTALKGFAASLSATGVAALRSDPRVVYIEADARVRIVADQANPPSWGLDRIDQRNLPLNNNYHYDATGSGVRAYIIDTGLRLSTTATSAAGPSAASTPSTAAPPTTATATAPTSRARSAERPTAWPRA